MCGRTSLFASAEMIAGQFDVAVETHVPRRYNIAPGDWLMTITNTEPDRVSRLEWGFVPAWADDPEAGPKPINARRERVHQAAPFRGAYRSRRCLVIVDGYYEWQEGPTGRRPFRFERRDREPFALAGIWDRWEGTDDTLETVAVLTADATDTIRDIHDRMPVILDDEAAQTWLQAPPADPATASALTPAWGAAFHHYPITTHVNNPANDDPTVIEPADSGGQPSLADF